MRDKIVKRIEALEAQKQNVLMTFHKLDGAASMLKEMLAEYDKEVAQFQESAEGLVASEEGVTEDLVNRVADRLVAIAAKAKAAPTSNGEPD